MWCQLSRAVLNRKRLSTSDALRQQCGCELSAVGSACSFTCGACLLRCSCQIGECKFLACGGILMPVGQFWRVLISVAFFWNFHLVFSRRSWDIGPFEYMCPTFTSFRTVQCTSGIPNCDEQCGTMDFWFHARSITRFLHPFPHSSVASGSFTSRQLELPRF